VCLQQQSNQRYMISDRSDWGDPVASYSHYLSRDNVYAILGGVAVCWVPVSLR